MHNRLDSTLDFQVVHPSSHSCTLTMTSSGHLQAPEFAMDKKPYIHQPCCKFPHMSAKVQKMQAYRCLQDKNVLDGNQLFLNEKLAACMRAGCLKCVQYMFETVNVDISKGCISFPQSTAASWVSDLVQTEIDWDVTMYVLKQMKSPTMGKHTEAMDEHVHASIPISKCPQSPNNHTKQDEGRMHVEIRQISSLFDDMSIVREVVARDTHAALHQRFANHGDQLPLLTGQMSTIQQHVLAVGNRIGSDMPLVQSLIQLVLAELDIIASN